MAISVYKSTKVRYFNEKYFG